MMPTKTSFSNWKIFGICIAVFSLFRNADCIATMAIDIGSEFMKVAIVKPGVPMEIALDRESQRKTPTVVSIRDGERLFGGAALNTAIKFPSKAFLYIPTLVGKRLSHPVVQQFVHRFPYYSIREDHDSGQLIFKIDEAEYGVEELLAMLLENARYTAEKYADFPIKDCVITVPPYFTQSERRAVLRAASLIDLNVLQLMNDNAAVALNYGIYRRKHFNSTLQHYMFFDLGSSSTVATIVGYNTVKTREAGMMEETPQVTVAGVGYDATLGATSFTMRLRDHLAKAFNAMKKTKKDVTKDHRAMAKLFKEAARVMKVLSANTEIFAQVENLLDDQDFKLKVTRAEFEEMCADLFKRVSSPIEQALNAAQLSLPLIKEVILMGGGSRIPKVQEMLMRSTEKSELGKSVNTDEAGALGAVYQAAYRNPGFRVKKFLIKDFVLYPVQVDFERVKPDESGKERAYRILRSLFAYGNAYPSKKKLTFNRQYKDFEFFVNYAPLNHLPEYKDLHYLNLTKVELQGVTEAHEKHLGTGKTTKTSDQTLTEAKGVQAHFRMDDSGIFSLDSVEASFEKSPEVVKVEDEQQSTFESVKDANGIIKEIGATFTNLFGGGDDTKKGEEKSAEEKKPDLDKEKTGSGKDTKTEEGKKSDNGKEKGTEDTKTKVNASATANDTKKEDPKPVITKEPIKIDVTLLDGQSPDDTFIAASRKKITALTRADEEKRLLEKSKNELESFIFENKDRLQRSEYVKCSMEEERTRIMEELTKTGDWYDEASFDTPKEEYISKLKELTQLMKDVEFRVRELKERPAAMAKLQVVLNTSDEFVTKFHNLTGEGKVFTQTEFESLTKVINESKAWYKRSVKQMKEMKLYEQPTFLVTDVLHKISSMEREFRYLLTKMQLWENMPPPTVEKNDTATNTSDTKDEKTKEETSSKEDKKEPKDGAKTEESQKTDEKTKEETSSKEEKKETKAEESQKSDKKVKEETSTKKDKKVKEETSTKKDKKVTKESAKPDESQKTGDSDKKQKKGHNGEL